VPDQSLPDSGQFEKWLDATAPAFLEKWLTLPRETRQELVSYGNLFVTFLANVNLGGISDSTESLAQSSGRIETLTQRVADLTKRFGWLTVFLIIETAALIGLTVYLALR
jgi:hypothetical protein